MNTFLILLDGPKGSGKTTIRKLLQLQLQNTEFLSLDAARLSIPGSRATNEFNAQAFEILFTQIRACLKQKKNVVLDSGLNDERFTILQNIAHEESAAVLAFSLIAPFETLAERVRERDALKGKQHDPERLRYTYTAQQSKDFSPFKIFDTTVLSKEEIVAEIMKEIQK